MTRERMELSELIAEMINLLVELESYMADPDPTERERLTLEVAPRLAQLRNMIN